MKFRYVYEHETTKEIRFMYFVIYDIERQDFFERFIKNFNDAGFILVSRDNYLGIKDRQHNDVYENDIVITTLKSNQARIKGKIKYYGTQYIIENQEEDIFPMISIRQVDIESLHIVNNIYKYLGG